MRKYNHTEFIRSTSRSITSKTANKKDVKITFYIEMYSLLKIAYNISDEYLKNLIVIEDNGYIQDDPRYASDKQSHSLYKDKEIVIFPANIKRDFRKVKEDYENELDYYLDMYFDALEPILLEFERIMVEREMKEDNDTESNLLRLLNNDNKTEEEKTYSLKERLAYMHTYEKIIMILEKMGLKAHPLYDLYEEKLNTKLHEGYHYENSDGNIVLNENKGTFISPTGRYSRIAKVPVEDFLEATDNVSSIHDRLYLGLPISEDEYFTYGNESLGRS